MIVLVLILAAIALAGLGFGATVWFAFRNRQKPTIETAKRESVPFRFSYIIAPIIVLLMSIILTVLFYPQLPAQVGYHFRSDGTPDRWLSREMAMSLMLVPQLLLTLLAGGITWGITKLGILSKHNDILGIKSQRMLLLMGNVAVLPQLILSFAVLDIFSYNSYRIHIMPMWVLLLVLGLATVALGILLIFLISKSRRKPIYQPEE